MSNVYIGIDPGASGGLALLAGTAVRFKAMPADEGGILDWLKWAADQAESGQQPAAALEEIQPAIFGIHKASSAKLYGSYTALRMALAAVGIRFESVAARVWQPALGIPPRRTRGDKKESDSQWKGRLKAEAERRFPSAYVTLATADALLLADYCRLKWEGKL